MSTVWLENLMYTLSGVFLAPVLILLAVMFVYSFFLLGAFTMQSIQRKKNAIKYQEQLEALRNGEKISVVPGYPILNLTTENSKITKDELDIAALKLLEGVRSMSRISPMLGLIATMIPMGPALKSLSDGNIQGISDNLVIAFSAVIFGLIISSITFYIASQKKRWYAVELVNVDMALNEEKQNLNAGESLS